MTQEQQFRDIAKKEVRGFTYGTVATIVTCSISLMVTIIVCTAKLSNAYNRLFELDSKVSVQSLDIKTNSSRLSNLEISDARQNEIISYLKLKR